MNKDGAGNLDGARRVVVHAPTLTAEGDAAREVGAMVLGVVLEQVRTLGEVAQGGMTTGEVTVSRPAARRRGPEARR